MLIQASMALGDLACFDEELLIYSHSCGPGDALGRGRDFSVFLFWFSGAILLYKNLLILMGSRWYHKFDE